MKKRYFNLFLFLCVLIFSYNIGCGAYWIDQLDRDNPKNEPFFKNDAIYDEDFNIDKLGKIVEPLYDEAKAAFPTLKEPVLREEGPPPPEGTEEEFEIAFVHLSDVQIRDERVKLFGKGASRILDNIIPSFEHSANQEHYDYAAYLALIKTINAYVNDESISMAKKPKLVIHTGDAVDSGVVEELYEFIYISNKLHIPWYNVLGNHDVTVFGNIADKEIYVNDPNLTFQTLHNKYNFINMHGGGHFIDPNINLGPDAAEHLMGPTGSRYHGFDLYDKKKNKKYSINGKYLCRVCPGYYSFNMRKENGDYKFVPPNEVAPPQNAREIVFIVLNTTTIATKLGARGTVDEDKQGKQINWLREQLEKHKEKLIFAFGHHPLDSFNFLDDSHKDLIELFHKYRVIAYFCGHTHVHEIRFHKKDGTKQGFWEVITDSIIEYPQEGSLINIWNLGKGIGAIDVQSFGKNITNACKCENDCKCKNIDSKVIKCKIDCKLKCEADLAFEAAKEDHFREINEQDRNARLTFSHPYFED